MRPGISPANAAFVGPAPKPERPPRAPWEFGIGNPLKVSMSETWRNETGLLFTLDESPESRLVVVVW
jgi:hypothetical protein